MTDFLNDDETNPQHDVSRYDQYSTEKPVDPRAGRLRPAPEVDEQDTAEAQDDASEFVDGDTVDADDPYGIGRDLIEGNSVRVADINAEAARQGIAPPRSQVELDREARFGSASTALRPAEWGRKGWVNRTFGMKLLPKDPSPEVAYRRGEERIQGVVAGVPVITIAQPKGGENKTGWCYTLASTLSSIRGKAAVAWDTTQSTGTLAMRAQNANPDGRDVWDLLENVKKLTSENTLHSAIDNFLVPQPTHCDILASDDSGQQKIPLDWSACDAAFAALRLHRGMVVVDTDNNHLATSWRWAMVHADQIVIPMTPRDDTIQQTEVMLRTASLDPEIGPQKVAEAIVLLSPLPSAPITPEQRETIDRMLTRYSVGEVFEMPYDPEFDGQRGRIIYDHLLHATKCGLVELAATIIDRLGNRATPVTGGLDLVASAPPASFTGEFRAQGGGFPGHPQTPAGYGYIDQRAAAAPQSGPWQAADRGPWGGQPSGPIPAQPQQVGPMAAPTSSYPIFGDPNTGQNAGFGAHRASGV